MVILDTNVISALMRPHDNPQVLAWIDLVPRSTIWTTAVSVFEVRFGLLIMADGRRRTDLALRFDALLAREFQGRVALFDMAAAQYAASLTASRRSAGRQIDVADAQIAGIALSRGAILVTRNTRDFEGLGLRLINPWLASSQTL